MKVLDRILYELAMRQYVERGTLQAMGGSNYGINKQLKMALSKGYIELLQYTFREGRRKKTIDIFRLTKIGFQHLCENMCVEIPWVDRIMVYDRVRMAGPSHAIKTIAERYIKISTAAVMADLVGAAETVTYLKAEQPGKGTGTPLMSELVERALDDYYCGRERTHGITFLSSTQMKSAIIDNARKNKVSEPDIRGGRYAGILDGPAMTALVYTSRGLDPLIWDKRFCQREMVAFRVARSLYYNYSFINSDTHGIMMAHDFEGFVRAYRGPKSTTKGKKEYRLGKQFSHFWVVPVDRSGVHELHWLLTADIEKEEKMVIDQLQEDELESYRDNVDLWASTFPLLKNPFYEYEEDIYVAVCLHVDVVRMHHIRDSIRRHPGHQHGIICREWQKPYFEEVLGDVAEIETVEDYYMRDKKSSLKMAVEKEAEIWLSEN